MKFSIYFLLILFAVPSIAQTYKDEKTLLGDNSKIDFNEEINVVQSKSFLNSRGNSIASGNTVYIEQVGSNNSSSIIAISNRSEISLLQDGTNNKTSIILNAESIRQNVTQIGNDNIFRDFSIHGAKIHEVDLTQQGSYNEVYSVGKNSISERIKISQNGIGKKAYITHN